MSMTRTTWVVPSAKTMLASLRFGVRRRCRRSSARLRTWRLASQVSTSASLSRLRCEALIDMTKPCSSLLDDDALEPPDAVDIGDDALADLAAEGADEDRLAGRDLDQLAGAFAPVREHATAEQIELNPLEAAPVAVRICECFR